MAKKDFNSVLRLWRWFNDSTFINFPQCHSQKKCIFSTEKQAFLSDKNKHIFTLF